MRALELQDFGLITYWYQAAFKDKKPTRKDKETLSKVQDYLRACTDADLSYTDEELE